MGNQIKRRASFKKRIDIIPIPTIIILNGFDSRLLSGLPVLAAVLEAGNLVRAGEALADAIGSESRYPALEERLGVRLFERTSKTMRLTETERGSARRLYL